MTMEEFFELEKIELSDLENKSSDSQYWESCFNFISENWDNDIEGMSEKQQRWAHKILEDMAELRIEGRL